MWSIKPAPLAQLGAAFALVMVLAGCASTKPATVASAKPPPPALTPLDQFKPELEPSLDRLALTPHPGGVLSEAQKAVLRTLAASLIGREDAKLTVNVPSSGGAGTPEDQTALAAASFLSASGVRVDQIRMARYEVHAGGAPIVLSHPSLVAKGPDCSKGWDDYAATGSNRVNQHFGCAAAANLAALVADPRDLAHPTGEQPADAARRTMVFDKYRKGELTASAKDDQASGAVSTAVK